MPRGILYSKLTIEDGEGVATNSHGVRRATYKITEKIGEEIKEKEIKGFFKPVSTEKHYPAKLAKWAVLISQMYLLFLGKSAAEDRLVYYATGEIAGTFSVAAPNATPMLFADQPDPECKQLAMYVNPNTDRLIQLNATEVLLACYYMKEDDAHAGQFPFSNDGTDKEGNFINPRIVKIDGDMSHYDKTGEIKKYRLRDIIWYKLPEKKLTFKSEHITNFPNITGPCYWPTNPSSIDHGKQPFKSMEAFKALAKSTKKVQISPNKQTSFKEQKFKAMLKLLLLFQIDAIKLRFKDALSINLSGELITDEDLIKEAIEYEQGNFDEFYLVTVLYSGDKATKDPSFNDFLQRLPSAFNEVKKYAIRMNNEWDKNGMGGIINLDEMERKYHQIWRDSFLSKFTNIRYQAHQLYEDLAKLVTISPGTKVDIVLPSKPTKEKGPITRSSQLIPPLSLAQVPDSKIMCDKKSQLRQAFIMLRDVTPILINNIYTYFKTPTNELTIEHNATMIEQLTTAHQKLKGVTELVGLGNDMLDKLNALLDLITETAVEVNLKQHIILRELNKDKPIDCQDKDYKPEVALYPYNDPKVVNDVIASIFNWAEDNKKEFDKLVKLAIKKYGESGLRANTIRTILNEGEGSRKNKLALMFGEENSGWEVGSIVTKPSFNVQLFNDLLTKIHNPNLHPKLKDLKKNGMFMDEVYKTKLKNYVSQNSEVFHPYQKSAVSDFEKVMYDWVDEQWQLKQQSLKKSLKNPEALQFEKKLKKAIDKYSENKAWGSSYVNNDSSEPIKQMLKEGRSYKNILLAVLVTSETKQGNDSSLSSRLFKLIWPNVLESNEKKRLAERENKSAIDNNKSAKEKSKSKKGIKNFSVFIYSLHGSRLLEALGINAKERIKKFTAIDFEKTMYDWVDEQWKLKQQSIKKGSNHQGSLVFETKLKQAITEYKKGKYISIFSSDSSKKIKKMLDEGKTYKHILSTIFHTSGTKKGDESSLATKLFYKLWPYVIGFNKDELSCLISTIHGPELLAKLGENAESTVNICVESEKRNNNQLAIVNNT